MSEDSCEILYWLDQGLVHEVVFEVFVLCKTEVWPHSRGERVSGYDQILDRRMAGVLEVEEEEDDLGEKLSVDLPVVIVRAMELVKMMSLSWISDVVRLYEVVGLGQGC